MPWWIWILFGFALLAAELLVTGISIGFFGTGAIIVGLLRAFGWIDSLAMQWLLFSLISVAGLLLLRPRLIQRLHRDEPGEVDSLVGETAVAMSDMAPLALGKAELRGSSWSARNVGTTPISSGERSRVRRVDGLTIEISADENR